MGGGDLNTKKSWHPNTMKNQERVWKAEQAAAEEKKRILELQREREEERDRAQLKEMAQRNFGTNSSAAGDNRLHWMYDKPGKETQQEDYLLGKAIGKSDEGDTAQNAIPVLSRRVAGSSMNTTGDDSQVDLTRKLREDPLLLVKERERAARAALLNNPLQRKKLADLLRKEQEQKANKIKKKSKKKGKDLDDALAAKLSALAGKKGIDLTSLLNSGDSSDSSSSKDEPKKKKKKKKSEKKKHKSSKKRQSFDSDTESSDDSVEVRKNEKSSFYNKDKCNSKHDSRKRCSVDNSDTDADDKKKKIRQDSFRNRSSSRSREVRRKDDSYKERENKSSKSSYKDSKECKYQHGKRISPMRTNHRDRSSESPPRRSGHRRASPPRRDKRQSTPSPDRRHRHRASPTRRDKLRILSPEPHRSSFKRSPTRKTNQREMSPESPHRSDSQRRASPHKKYEGDRSSKKHGLSEEEKAARLAAMVMAGQEREVERGKRVARQRAEDAKPVSCSSRALNNEARALPDSLESRIHSNRHYIQRDRLHMNENFAKR